MTDWVDTNTDTEHRVELRPDRHEEQSAGLVMDLKHQTKTDPDRCVSSHCLASLALPKTTSDDNLKISSQANMESLK